MTLPGPQGLVWFGSRLLGELFADPGKVSMATMVPGVFGESAKEPQSAHLGSCCAMIEWFPFGTAFPTAPEGTSLSGVLKKDTQLRAPSPRLIHA